RSKPHRGKRKPSQAPGRSKPRSKGRMAAVIATAASAAQMPNGIGGAAKQTPSAPGTPAKAPLQPATRKHKAARKRPGARRKSRSPTRSQSSGAARSSTISRIASPVAALPLVGAAPSSARRTGSSRRPRSPRGGPIERTVHDIVEVLPRSVEIALAALAALSIMLAGGYLFATLRARRLGRQRAELLDQVGLLQAALLPAVPRRLRSLRVSVAYRPADGPGAGGDFYDVIPLPDARTGFIVGDISGHGRAALASTAFLRYTL